MRCVLFGTPFATEIFRCKVFVCVCVYPRFIVSPFSFFFFCTRACRAAQLFIVFVLNTRRR